MYQASALAVIVAVVAAAPAPDLHAPGFTLDQVSVGKVFLNGPAAYGAAFVKYGKPMPAGVQEAAAAIQSGSVSANPEAYDRAYLSPVSIGTPAQVLNMDFDTGSSDLWVYSSLQPAAQRNGHSIYTPGSSSTSKVLSGETWNISYADGSGASGVVYTDKVVIGGVTVTTQAVEAATSVSSSFTSDVDNDGLVGFAFDSINTAKPTKVKTWITNALSTLPSPIFASYLRKGQAGAYDFGYINASRYTGALTYTSINSARGFWEFTSNGYTVGTTFTSISLDCIADTGTSLVYLPGSAVTNYYSKVSGAGYNSQVAGYIFPCTSSLPNLGINVGGVSKTIPGSYINYAPVGSGYCYGGLQSSDGLGLNILGDVFLKSQYVVWDRKTPRLGVAAQR